MPQFRELSATQKWQQLNYYPLQEILAWDEEEERALRESRLYPLGNPPRRRIDVEGTGGADTRGAPECVARGDSRLSAAG